MTFVKIANIENSIEAQVLESVLKERDIPFRLRSFYDTAYDGLFQFHKGWGEIYAPPDCKEEILEIIESNRQWGQAGQWTWKMSAYLNHAGVIKAPIIGIIQNAREGLFYIFMGVP